MTQPANTYMPLVDPPVEWVESLDQYAVVRVHTTHGRPRAAIKISKRQGGGADKWMLTTGATVSSFNIAIANPVLLAPAAELDALRDVARAATVIAAGDHVDPHEREQALDALPHLLEHVALAADDDVPAAPTVAPIPLADFRGAAITAVLAARPGLAEAHAQDEWAAAMAACGGLTPEHRAAFMALVVAGVQPFQMQLIASALRDLSTDKESGS
jgi:hypothetical protein